LVVGRAITREVWGREAAAQVIAGRAIAATLMQAFAPVLGGYLQGWFGWRSNFLVIAAIACAAMALVAQYVPEGRATTPLPSRTGGMLASYGTLIRTRRFLSYAFTAAGSHAGFHIFAAGAPAVLIVGLGIRPEDYGFYASLPPMGFLIGSFLSNRLTRRLGVDGLITIGCMLLIPTASIMVTLAVLGVASPYAVIGPMILICCSSGLVTPNATAGSLGVNAGIVGAASGLGSFVQMTGAAGATALLSLGPSGNPVMLASIIALAGLVAVTAFWSLHQRDQALMQAAATA
jgi:MFS transporter, DHA1 family, multidrug resistance protein